MNKRNIGILVLFLSLSLSVIAQGRKSLKINEVLIQNETNFEDDYGVRSAWIEIFNTAFSTVDIKSCYLTNDKNDPQKYPIPKSDVQTVIAPRQHLLFWADGMPNRGTFHVSFTLDPEKENWIGLYDANGKTLLDSVTVPAGIPVDHSWARKTDGEEGWVLKGGNDPMDYVTPSTNNVTIDSNEKIDMFAQYDKHGVGMAIMAMSVVFSGLLLLYILFRLIGAVSVRLSKRNAMKSHGISDKEEAKAKEMGRESGEVYAAIAMALHAYLNTHDVEDTVLTINQVKKAYSPWSSKIYTLREVPSKK